MFAIPLGDDGAELRPLEPWHAEEYLAHIDRSRAHIGRYIGLADAAADLPAARAFLQSYAEKLAADRGRIYGIWLEGTLVGGVLFRTFDAAQGTCEVGCWLEESATGRGLITRALHHLIDWAVDVRGVHRVEWHADSANAASLKTAARLGLSRDAVLRSSFVRHGERRDAEVWSVLAPEWRAHRETLNRG
ncbi:GNAT family N-acetyltransferase [Streptomyces sp. 796.1]|uniref:GNAT family N-acetyltransferase n=1 Tax=Streptomyces sp. 796.1 TaxID=3163029 RepID=UPI0039C98CDB